MDADDHNFDWPRLVPQLLILSTYQISNIKNQIWPITKLKILYTINIIKSGSVTELRQLRPFHGISMKSEYIVNKSKYSEKQMTTIFCRYIN